MKFTKDKNLEEKISRIKEEVRIKRDCSDSSTLEKKYYRDISKVLDKIPTKEQRK